MISRHQRRLPGDCGLQELLGATLTRGFRRGFLLAAGIALLALIPVATLRPRQRT